MSESLNVNYRTLSNFVNKEIKQNIYLIPNFQRDFVWKKSDIEELGNSIINDFPISNILIMEKEGSLDLETKEINVSFKLKENKTKEQYYVLDGQQRITAIAEIFLSGNYYFDLFKLLKELDNKLELDPPIYLNKADLNKVENTESYCVYLKTKNLNSLVENTRFLCCQDIINGSFTLKIISFLEQFKNNENYVDYLNYLNNLIGLINSYQISKFKIEKNTPLDKVIQIFEKVNSTGKDLNISDLLEAKSCKIGNNGLGFKEKIINDLADTIMFNIDLKHFFSSTLNISINEKISLNDISLFVRLCELNKIASIDCKYHFISKSSLLKSNSNDWFIFWEESKSFFIDYILWLKKSNLQDIINKKIFEFVFVILFKNKHLFDNQNYMNEFKKFIYYYNFEENITNNNKLLIKLNIFSKFTFEYKEGDKLNESFLNFSRFNSMYIKKLELTNKIDILTIINILIFETNYLKFSIFKTPLNKDKKYLKLFDRKEFSNLFVNQIIIDKDYDLKTDSFITILQNIEQRLSDNELDSRLKNNFLSKDIEDFTSFEDENSYLTKRSELIFKAIEDYFQN